MTIKVNKDPNTTEKLLVVKKLKNEKLSQNA